MHRAIYLGELACGAAIVAQAGNEGLPATPTTIIGAFILVSLSLVGLVGWTLRHIFTTTIPAMQQELKDERTAHEKTVADICNSFKAAADAERKLCEEKFALVNANLVALTASGTQDRVAMVAEINRHTTEQAAAYRHDLNGTIHEAVLGKELWLATKRSKELEDERRKGQSQ